MISLNHMNKKIFLGGIVAGVVIVAGAFAPSASALSFDDIQAQIKALLAQVADLSKQLQELRAQQSPPSEQEQPMPSKYRICNILNRNLSQGVQGDDVASLQEFLSGEGYLSANATGYFGPMTGQAVAKWQAAQGVQSVGSVGPMTRERIKVWCGGGNNRFSASPMRGQAPLTVTFVAPGGMSCVDGGDYKIDFGDGTSEMTPQCRGGMHPITHTYSSDATYSAVLYGIPSGFGGGSRDPQAVARLQINVGPIACTKEYNPVCGSKPIVCITTPCNPIQQTYSNRCAMNADGATFVHEGQCRTDYTNPADDPQCKSWFDGCNTCSRQSPGSPAMCTLMACMMIEGAYPKPYCKEYFGTAGNRPPTISSFSGPTTIAVNQTGTWTINASDPENGNLTYSITWGDEYGPLPMASMAAREMAFVQMTTFTHSYASAGTYTVTIVVRDSAGKDAKTSSTVRVGNLSLDCSMIPTTMGPESLEWRAKCAPVACTMDAMQCQNGSYVGRTGPNCQFICPN